MRSGAATSSAPRRLARPPVELEPGGPSGGGERAEEPNGGAVQRRIFAAYDGVAERRTAALHGFQRRHHRGLRPSPPLALPHWIEAGGPQRRVVGLEAPHGSRMKARIVLL